MNMHFLNRLTNLLMLLDAAGFVALLIVVGYLISTAQ